MYVLCHGSRSEHYTLLHMSIVCVYVCVYCVYVCVYVCMCVRERERSALEGPPHSGPTPSLLSAHRCKHPLWSPDVELIGFSLHCLLRLLWMQFENT